MPGVPPAVVLTTVEDLGRLGGPTVSSLTIVRHDHPPVLAWATRRVFQIDRKRSPSSLRIWVL